MGSDADELAGGAVENFRAKGIGLEEGERGDLEFQSEEFFIEVVLSVEHFCLIALYNICQEEWDLMPLVQEVLGLPLEGKVVGFLHIINDSLADVVVVTCVPLFKVRKHAGQNLCEILMHDFSVARGQDIVGASLFMKSEGVCIPE